MPDVAPPWPTIPDPGNTVRSLQSAVIALKETVELLTGQRGPRDQYSVDQRMLLLTQQNDNAFASILQTQIAVVNGDTALAQSVSQLTTTVDGNTATLQTLQQSVDGISLNYGVVGTINGSTGGFIFSGVRKNDGTGAIFNLEINSNVTINGDVVINGTITNPKITNNAVSQSSASVGADVATVGMNIRAGARVLVVGYYRGDGGLLISNLNPVPIIYLVRDGGVTLEAVVSNINTLSLGAAGTYTRTQTTLTIIDNPGAGFHTWSVFGGFTGSGYVITVTELAK